MSQYDGKVNGVGKYIPTELRETNSMVLSLKPGSVTELVYDRIVDLLDLGSELPDYCNVEVSNNKRSSRLGIGNDNAYRILAKGGELYFQASCPSDVDEEIKSNVESDALSGLHEILKGEDCLKRSKSGLAGLVGV
jgi:hypothetical protein